MRLPCESTMVRRGPKLGALQVDRHARAEFADDEVRLLAAAASTQRAGAVQIIPLRLVFAVAVEHLHAVVLAVGDIDPAVGIGRDIVDDVELAGIGAGLAPGFEQLAVRRIFVDAGIAVAVGNIDLALRRQRGVGAAVKRLAAHERRRLVRDADRQQHLSVGRALAHGVVAVIGAVEIVVGIDVQAVGAVEQAFAPAGDEIALAVQHHHRMFAAVEDVDAVLAVDRDGGDVGKAPAVRQFCPSFRRRGNGARPSREWLACVSPHLIILLAAIVAEACVCARGHIARGCHAPLWNSRRDPDTAMQTQNDQPAALAEIDLKPVVAERTLILQDASRIRFGNFGADPCAASHLTSWRPFSLPGA